MEFAIRSLSIPSCIFSIHISKSCIASSFAASKLENVLLLGSGDVSYWVCNLFVCMLMAVQTITFWEPFDECCY